MATKDDWQFVALIEIGKGDSEQIIVKHQGKIGLIPKKYWDKFSSGDVVRGVIAKDFDNFFIFIPKEKILKGSSDYLLTKGIVKVDGLSNLKKGQVAIVLKGGAAFDVLGDKTVKVVIFPEPEEGEL
ncbi:MAG TPA: hypothetical protein ENH28_00715 [Euryarchaeota archaeon]|nr:hypothetical protein [Euryarchaeota archaeon]